MGIVDYIKQILTNRRHNQEFASFDDHSVSWAPDPIHYGDKIKILYNGPLTGHGDRLYLHYGFDGWSAPHRTVQMNRLENGNYEAIIKTEGMDEVNFCFNDSSNHWDNNQGKDWTLYLY